MNSSNYHLRTFRRGSNEYQFYVRKTDGQVWAQGFWWEPKVLKEAFGVQEVLSYQPLPKQVSPPFGAPPKGKFTTNKCGKRSNVGRYI